MPGTDQESTVGMSGRKWRDDASGSRTHNSLLGPASPPCPNYSDTSTPNRPLTLQGLSPPNKYQDLAMAQILLFSAQGSSLLLLQVFAQMSPSWGGLQDYSFKTYPLHYFSLPSLSCIPIIFISWLPWLEWKLSKARNVPLWCICQFLAHWTVPSQSSGACLCMHVL